MLLQESPVLPHDQVVKCILCRGGGGRGGVGEDTNGQASVHVQPARVCGGDVSSQRANGNLWGYEECVASGMAYLPHGVFSHKKCGS